MERRQMILDLIKYELQFLISNPEYINAVSDWIADGELQKIDNEKLEILWNIKIK